MLLKDLSFASPQENILYDEVLFRLAEAGTGGEALRFWESKETFVVLGRAGKVEEDVHLDNVQRDGISVLRRTSGGGTVLQGKGCLNYCLVLSKECHPDLADLHRSYRFILEKIISSLKNLKIDAVFWPISDLAIEGNEKKFSGNAQHRGRKYILHHGTVLYDFDLCLMDRYLRMPCNMPVYRRGRRHQDFVTNVNFSSKMIKQALCEVFSVTAAGDSLSVQERQSLERLKAAQRILVELPGKAGGYNLFDPAVSTEFAVRKL